ncbi:MAG: discoidin domain-containing protein [Tyzzerella sp.]|nr:discoidin domain-containing protein [Tyzzerella sp.]
MKKIAKRFVGLICAVALAVTSFGTESLALTINDSSWVTTVDVEWQNPTEIVNAETQEKQFILTTKTAQGRVNNLYFSFPTEGGVRFHADDTGFWNPEETSVINYTSEGAAIVMQANDTKVRVYTTASPWRFEVYNAEDEMVIWYQADKMYFGYDEKGNLSKVKIASAVDEYETLFGLGERFSGLSQNGKTVEMWNYDSFSQLRRSYGDQNVGYKNVPILHSNNGYTVFHNNTYYGIVDVADTKKDECSFEFNSPILDMYVWSGSTLENIDSYCELTGSSVTVPKDMLSYWAGQAQAQWYKNGKTADEVLNTVKTTIEKYEALGTPIKMVHLEGIGTNTTYESVRNYLDSKNIKFLGWMNSDFRTFDDGEGRSATELRDKIGLTNATAPLVTWNYAKLSHYYDGGGYKYLDWGNPDSKRWLEERLNTYMEDGLIGMMVDFNDTIQEDAYYPSLDKTGLEMHNLSQYYYAKAVYETFEEYYGEGNFVNIVRAGVAGSQSYGAVFAGDQTSTFLGLQQVVSSLLSSATAGYNVWGSDIGALGHVDDAKKNDPELYARWVQLATFTPLMRAHGQTSWRDPWAYSDSSVDLFQEYYWTRESIVDLINSGQLKASVENHPMTQSMVVAYPEQKKLATNETQYLFCDSLLVCPVTESGVSSLEVQFPEGRWVNIWDGTVYAGDTKLVVDASLDTIPVYLEAGSAIPVTLGAELSINGINTEGKNTNALMIAPAVEKKENVIYLDKATTQTYTSDVIGENTYSVSSANACDKNIVVAMGITATNVKVGNTELKELSKRPTSASTEAGFYRDIENNSTIIVTGGNWTSLEYSGSSERFVNVALGANVTTTGLSEKNEADAQNITDGDYATDLTVTEGKKTSVVIDLKENYKLNKILVKWGGAYARSYKLEVSDSNAEDAKWTVVFEKDKGGGGTDTVLLDSDKEYRYIRMTDIDTLSKTGAKLVEVEAYGDATQKVEDIKTSVVVLEEEVTPTEEIPAVLWYVVGGVSAAILLGCAAAAFLIGKKKKKVVEGN